MKFARLIALTAILLSLGITAQAGDLSQNLSPIIESGNSAELVRVWIKLNRVEPAAQFKAAIDNTSTSMAARHEAGIRRLQSDHLAAQADLVDELRSKEVSGTVRDISAYWIANVVEAEIAIGELEQLALRADVDRIYAIPEHSLITPDEPPVIVDPSPSAVESNIEYVRADVAWGMGYTGEGRLICSFDTGIQGTHPALFDRWKGHDGDSAAAWFDPRGGTTFPSVIADCGLPPCNSNHGTHTMGLACGYDPDTDYNIGVAPGAKWISAAIIDIAGVNILQAFEWAADPDGNPNTIDDVPDVINHSWGYSNNVIECENLFYDVIDNVEALGIVNVFAAGNTAGAGTVYNPANGDRNNLDCFAVGNIDVRFPPSVTLASNSSQGPSDCRSGTKPNAVAPGVMVTSSIPTDNYGTMSGTSMAAPHVAGLVALLREKNPDATASEIKQAILDGCHTEAGFGTLPNNTFGWGAIDCVASLSALSTPADPSVRVYDFTHPATSPGDTIVGTIVLQNLGTAVSNVTATLAGIDPSLTILDGSAAFGPIGEGDTVRSGDIIRIAVSDTVTEGSILSLDLIINGTAYMNTTTLYIVLDPMSQNAMITHDIGLLQFSVTNYGAMGLGVGSMFQAGGVGFIYDGGPQEMYEAGIMIGRGPTQVSSAIHSVVDKPDYDFSVAPGGNMVFEEPGTDADEQSFSGFSDYNSSNPIGLIIRQETRAYLPVTGDFILLSYTLENPTASAINGVYLGLFLDWDCNALYNQNSGGWESADGYAWMAFNSSGLSHFRGVKLVEGTLASVHTAHSPDVGYIKFWGATYDGYTTAEKWGSLTHGFASADTYKTSTLDLFQVMSAGPMDIPSGGSEKVTFAILAGDTQADILAAANASQATDAPWDAGDPILPVAFNVLQNSPNPFNPSTVMAFDLPKASEYTLSIYNVLGQEVYTTSARSAAGRVEVEWDAGDHASGVYLYKVTAGEYTDSKKMVLMK